MTKMKTKILNIMSFGLLGLFAKKQVKKQNLNPELKIKTSISFDFEPINLIKALGDTTNIKDCTSTINTITFKIIDSSLVDKNNFKQFNARGLLINKQSVNILFGNNAQAIAQSVNALLAKKIISPDSKIVELIKGKNEQNIKIDKAKANRKIDIPIAPICVDNTEQLKKEKELEAEAFIVGDCDA